MAVSTRSVDWPFAMAVINSTQVPCIIRRWERGFSPSPQEWHARIVFAANNGPAETLVSAKQISPAGRPG